MSIVLAQEFVSPKEAYITWTVSSALTFSSKGFLYLTDITPSRDITQSLGDNVFPIVKYQLRHGELNAGSHVFYDLTPGSYIAELSIITGNSSISSDPFIVNVYDLAAPVFVGSIIPANNYFTVYLSPPAGLRQGQNIEKVTFILLGKRIVGGNTQSFFDNNNSLNIYLNYRNDNTYVIGNVVNNVEYEIACFYTDNNGMSSILSDTRIETPTNYPNKITELSAAYNSAAQTLTITHNMPSNASDYDMIDCRATITNTATNVVTYYHSSNNSAELSPAPTAADPIVFNMKNKNLLPVDTPFTLTISVKNELGHWGPVESEALNLIHTSDYQAISLVPSNLNYSVELNSISISDNSSYVKRTPYDIHYTAEVFECDVDGDIISPAVAVETKVNNMNFSFSGLDTGSLYRLTLKVKYVYGSFPIINQKDDNAFFYYFIPHDAPKQLSLTATPSDHSVTVNWLAISESDLQGFLLDHYEVSHDISDEANWIGKGLNLSHTFTGLTNGSSYPFYARAVSVSGRALTTSGNIPFRLEFSASESETLTTMARMMALMSLRNGETSPVGLADSGTPSPPSGMASGQIPVPMTTTVGHETLSSESRVNGDNSSVTSVPYGAPDSPMKISQKPGNNKSTIVWSLTGSPYNGGEFVRFEASVNSSPNSEITPSFDSVTGKYTHDFMNLINLETNDIRIRVVTRNVSNVNNANTFKESIHLLIATMPFTVPDIPTGFFASPSTTTVRLDWNPVSPASIILNNVKYELHYKLQTDSDSNFTSVSDVGTSSMHPQNHSVNHSVTNLTSNLMYVFKIRSTIYNVESDSVYKSEFTDLVLGRPFVHLYAPNMNLVAGSETITVKLSPNVNNYFPFNETNISFKYTATITHNTDPDNTLTKKTLTVIDKSEQSILFTDFPPAFDLINLSEYTIVAYYEMLNTDNDRYCSSSNISNQIKPFDANLAPVLSSVSYDKKISLSLDISALDGYDITNYQVSFGNNNWALINFSDTTDEFVFIQDVIADRLGAVLVNGTQYTLSVRAVYNINGEVYNSLPSNTVTNVPYIYSSAPTGIQSTASNRRVTVSWSVPSDLGGLALEYYQVRQGANGSWESVNKDTSKIFTGLTNGDTYTFFVRAVTKNDKNEDVYGDSVSTTNKPFGNSSAPGFVSCVEGDQSLSLTWSEPSDLGGLDLHHYEVKIHVTDETDSDEWLNVGTVTTKEFTGLDNGENYSVYVKAVLYSQFSGNSDSNILTRGPFYPYKAASAPVFANCVESDSKLTFSWSQPLLLGGLDVHHYEVKLNNNAWLDVGTATTKEFTGLTNGQEYRLRVKAYTTHPNLLPIEGAVLVTNPFYPYKAASAPVFVSCAEGDQSLLLTWSVPSDLGGINVPVHHYKVQINNNDWLDVGTATTKEFTGLDNGLGYTLRVKAYTTHPNLLPIEGTVLETILFYPYKAASAPIFVECVESDRKLVFSWSVPSDLGGINVPVHHYKVQINNNAWLDVGTATTKEFTQLDNGSLYLLRVKAFTTHPNLLPIEGATLVTESFMPFKVPPPTTVTSVPKNGAVDFSWTDAGQVIDGLPFLDYQVSTDDPNTNEDNWTDQTTNTYTLNGSNGASLTLYVRVRATHRAGTNYTRSIHSLTALDTNIPYISADPVEHNSYATDPSPQQIRFSWTELSEYQLQLSGLQLAYYEVSKDQGNSWVPADSNTSHTFTGLTNGQPYNMLARAVTMHSYLGEIRGRFDSANYITDRPYRQASAPTNIVATPSNGSVSFTWNAVTNLGGLDFVNYGIAIGQENDTEINDLDWQSSTTNSFTFNSLTNGNNYTFYITAFTIHSNPNINGVIGDVGEVLNVVPYADPDGLVIDKVIGDRQIQLSWPIPNLGGLTIDNYKLTYNSVSYKLDEQFSNPNIVYTTDDDAISHVTITGLTNGQLYNYSVAAVTSHPYLGLKTGPTTNVSGTPFGTPGLVANIKATAINNNLDFSFTGPVDTNNNAITQYYEYSIDDLNFINIYQLLEFTRTINNNNLFTLRIRCFIMNPNDPLVRVTGDIQQVTGLQNVEIKTPQNLKATVEDGLVELTWDPITNALFQVIRYFPNGSVIKAFTSSTSFKIDGLTNGISYSFGVNIYDIINDTAGPVSNITAIPVSKPVINSVSKSGDILSLNINFGGSSKININFVAAYVGANSSIISRNVSRVVNFSSSVNPINFSEMGPYTFFNIAVSNSSGQASGTYTV